MPSLALRLAGRPNRTRQQALSLSFTGSFGLVFGGGLGSGPVPNFVFAQLGVRFQVQLEVSAVHSAFSSGGLRPEARSEASPEARWDRGGEAVPALQSDLQSVPMVPAGRPAREEVCWYAVHTVARHEKRVVQQLEESCIHTFLPLIEQRRRWSDRWARVDVPLFTCYAFVQIVQASAERLRVLRVPGVLGFVGQERGGSPIPDQEIENLQTLLREKLPMAAHPFVSAGKRVRLRGGSLDGVTGILLGRAGESSLIVSVELLQRSVSLRVEGYAVELA